MKAVIAFGVLIVVGLYLLHPAATPSASDSWHKMRLDNVERFCFPPGFKGSDPVSSACLNAAADLNNEEIIQFADRLKARGYSR